MYVECSTSSQDACRVDLESSLGYLLKRRRAPSAPRWRKWRNWDERDALSCLELLAQRPGLSNSELATGAFVTRQSMNVLLQALEQESCMTRPARHTVGKALPTRLTPRGRRSLTKAGASGPVRRGQNARRPHRTERQDAFRILRGMIHALRESSDEA